MTMEGSAGGGAWLDAVTRLEAVGKKVRELAGAHDWVRDALRESFEGFLALNARYNELLAEWQALHEATPWERVGELPPRPPDPGSTRWDNFIRFDDADKRTIAFDQLAALADVGSGWPIVPEPAPPGEDAAADAHSAWIVRAIRWRGRLPITKDGERETDARPDPRFMPPNIAEDFLQELERWTRAEAARRATPATDPTAPATGDSGRAGAVTTTKPGGGSPKWVRSDDAARLSGLSANAILRRSKREKWRVTKSGRMNCYLLSDLERAWPDKIFRPIKGEL